MTRTNVCHAFVLALTFVVVAMLYWPGVHGGIYFDDSHVLVENKHIRLESLSWDGLKTAANSFLAGNREISMLSFALNYYVFGDRIIAFKLVNVALHILGGGLLYVFMRRLLGSPSLRLAASQTESQLLLHCSLLSVIAWMLAPINLGSVLYISQRMAVLAFIFVSLGLIAHLVIRDSRLPPGWKWPVCLVSMVLFTALGYGSKENGILLPGYILLVELLALRPFSDHLARIWKSKRALVLVGVAVAVLLVTFVAIPLLGNRLSYSGREFSMAERVMTQFRAIGFYLSQILVPNNAELSMWHDDIRPSGGLLDPVTTLIGLLVILVLFGFALASWFKKPVIGFAILWFFLGHSLESTIFPLELMHEHRNYYASFGVFLLIFYLVLSANIRIYLKAILIILILGLNASVLYARSEIWSIDIAKAAHEARYHPDSPNAQFSYARYLYMAARNGDADAAVAAHAHLEQNRKLDQLTMANESLLLLLASETSVDADPVWVESAIQKVKNNGYNAITSQAISGLLEYIQSDKSTLPISLVAPLYDYLGKVDDSRLVTFGAIFYSEVAADYPKALRLYHKAVDNAPNNATFSTNLLRAQLKFKQFGEACQTLDRIHQMDDEAKLLLKPKLEQAAQWLDGRCAEPAT